MNNCVLSGNLNGSCDPNKIVTDFANLSNKYAKKGVTMIDIT